MSDAERGAVTRRQLALFILIPAGILWAVLVVGGLIDLALGSGVENRVSNRLALREGCSDGRPRAYDLHCTFSGVAAFGGLMTHPANLNLTRHEMLTRALEWTKSELPNYYRLGYGGRDPAAPTPFRVEGGLRRCDCSGFVAWAGGLDRFQKMTKAQAYQRRLDYDAGNGGVWFNTANIVNDAKGAVHTFYRQVEMKEAVLPGDIVIYPPHPAMEVKVLTADGGFFMKKIPKKTYGHTGVITWVAPDFHRYRGRRPGWGFKLKVAHCSTVNKANPRAVRESDAGIWERDTQAIIIRRTDMEV